MCPEVRVSLFHPDIHDCSGDEHQECSHVERSFRIHELHREADQDRADGGREFFLGISDDDVFESSDPTTGAISAVVGTPTR